jgi:hypothetical protein
MLLTGSGHGVIFDGKAREQAATAPAPNVPHGLREIGVQPSNAMEVRKICIEVVLLMHGASI